MTIIDAARSALIGLPISDILRERLSLSIEYAADLERQAATCHTKNGQLHAELEAVTLDRNEHREKYDRLQKEHEEETSIYRSIEFRRGNRTNGKWLPFCPVCHMPVTTTFRDRYAICSGSCGWQSGIENGAFTAITKDVDRHLDTNSKTGEQGG